MDKYYYLVSSLPLLLFESEKVLSEDEFLEQCRANMSDRDYTLMEMASIRIKPEGTQLTPILEEWWNWESKLRKELAKYRSKKLGFNEEDFSQVLISDTTLADAVKKAFEEKSPLNAEIVLDRARWDFLSNLGLGHYFDLTFIILYYLKIQIRQRQDEFNQESGSDEFSRTKESILQKSANNQEKTLENVS